MGFAQLNWAEFSYVVFCRVEPSIFRRVVSSLDLFGSALLRFATLSQAFLAKLRYACLR